MGLIIGVSGSLVATVIWWILSQLYSFDTRKRIAVQIILLRNDNYDYQKFLEYKDYDLALVQAQRMLEEIGEFYSLIRKCTYTPTKRKLVNTLLNNLYILISRFQTYYEGHDKTTEKEVCCEKAMHELYTVGYVQQSDGKWGDPYDFQSVSEITIEILSALNYETKNTVRKILATGFFFNGNVDIKTRKKYLKDLINHNSFKGSHSKSVAKQFDITDHIFCKDEYEKLIDSLK